MADELTALRTLLRDLSRRRTALAWRRSWWAGALTAAVALLATRLALALIAPAGLGLLLLVMVGALVAVAAVVVGLRSSPSVASPAQLARLIEERHGGLDDVVVTAVDYAERPDHHPAMADRLAAGALRALGSGAADRVIPGQELTTAGRRAAAAAIALVAGVGLLVGPLRQAAEIAAAYVVPAWLSIAVEPGDVRVRAGRPVTIRARVNRGEALAPVLVVGEDAATGSRAMTRAADGAFEATIPDVTASFGYYVDAGARRSDRYTVTVVQPARVERIDLDFRYPAALGLEPRHEDRGGDIYAPEGTDVTLTVTTDRAVTDSALLLQDGTRVSLHGDGRVLSGRLTVAADGAYRVVLVDDDRTEMPDDTEYFIRTLLDRPPDVRVLKPAGDKQVTPLEEVVIEARADDDYGVRSFELVLQKPGDAEVVVPLRGTSSALTVNGAHTLYLEDLEVAPGDIVSYYVRARDVGRGKPPSETRSDMYFLEVKAFNDEFVAAQSQAMAAGGQAQGVQDLAAAQKAIIVATWKLDSRSRRANRTAAARDIATVAEAQRALEQRAAKEAGSQLQASGGGRRRRGGRATVNGVGDDPLGVAIEAMRRAAQELDRQQTAKALPHEMEALDQLLKAEADVQRRQVARQQAGGGGGNRSTPDLSALFDQELRKQQETNYETPASSETRQDETRQDDPLEKLRELARRQEALSREQQDLAGTPEALEAEARKRRLERLRRDQEALQRELEQLAQEMPRQPAPREPSASQTPESAQAGRQPDGQSPGSQRASSSSPSGATGSATGQSGNPSSASMPTRDQALREAMQEMQAAASGLRDQDASRASSRSARALERLRQAEDALRGSTADDLRRRLADVQMEARQLAEAQRRLATQARTAATDPAGTDRASREQERLAERADRLRQRMRALAEQASTGEGRAMLDQAGREMETGRAAALMHDAAEALARAGGESRGRRDASPGSSSATSTRPPGDAEASSPAAEAAARAARLGADAARALDRVAERLDARRTADAPAAARLSDDLTKARELREQLERVERSLADLRSSQGEGPSPAPRRDDAATARSGAGTPSPGDRDGRAGGEIERLQRQLAEQMREARAQVDALGRASAEMRAGSTPEEWQPSVSAPGTEAFKQDFARWETLKRNLLLALEKVERGLADELRQHETKDRWHAGRSDAVPDDYRKLVDKYYRSLAAPRRPER